jgi:DNA-binding LacI/PurR family transcriptional regulator
VHEGQPEYTVTTNLFYAQVLRGIELAARSMNYQCIVSTMDELERDFSAVDEIMTKVDGLILGELRCQRLHDHIVRNRYPTTLISPSIHSQFLDIIKIDSYSGSLEAVDYLASLGHKRIAFVGGSKDSYPAQERLEGYISGLKKNGLSVSDQLIRISGWNFEMARDAVCDLLEKEEFTAILAASDHLAFAALQLLREHNRRVPDDISVIGFDDLEVSAQQSPPLTSVRVHKEHLGKLAVNMLFARLDEDRNFATFTTVPSELIHELFYTAGEVRFLFVKTVDKPYAP